METRELGVLIKEYRKRKKLTQEQLANIIGVSRPTIAKYETTVSEPSKYKMHELCDALGREFTSHVTSLCLFQHTIPEDVIIERVTDGHVCHKSDNEGKRLTCVRYKKKEYCIESDELYRLCDRFIEHMKIEFNAFIEDYEKIKKEKEQKHEETSASV